MPPLMKKRKLKRKTKILNENSQFYNKFVINCKRKYDTEDLNEEEENLNERRRNWESDTKT